jgi:hypothetical protein
MRRSKEETEPIYSTLDAYQAGFLTLRGHTPNFIQQGDKIVFVFSGNDSLYKDLSDYNSGAKVEALRLSVAIKSLKSQIHSMRRGKGDIYDKSDKHL